MKTMKFMIFVIALTFCVEVSAQEAEMPNTQAPVAAQEVTPVEQPAVEQPAVEQPAVEQPKVESVQAEQTEAQPVEPSTNDAQAASAEDEDLKKLIDQFTKEDEASAKSEASN